MPSQNEPIKVGKTVRVVISHGIEKTLKAWSESTGIPISTIYSRLDRGISPEKALDPSLWPPTKPKTGRQAQGLGAQGCASND